MNILVTEHSHCDQISITGRLDSYSAPQIKAVLNSTIENGKHNIIIDLEDVNFVSSSGILAFVNAQRQLKQQNKGELVFVNVSDLVLSNFTIAGFDTIFSFYQDLTTAIEQFRKPHS